jgi:hypothetical protein
VGALHGSAWLPRDWLEQLEQHPDEASFFDAAAVRQYATQAGGAARLGGSAPGPVVVRTTRDMGRDGAVQLARLLAMLDVGGA